MKIYFLRHELRPLNDSTFLTELFYIGKQNSKTSLKDLLNTLNIDKIYSSPFIRVLQTVDSFAKENNIKLLCDYSLAETVTEKTFLQKPDMTLSNFHNTYFNIDERYISLFDKNKLIYLEDDKQIQERVNNFCQYLENTYDNQDINILVAGHMEIVNICLGYFSKKDINKNTYYAMGQVSCVENGKIIYLNKGSELSL